MAMGKRTSEQTPMWVASTDLPVSPDHPFFARLNAILDAAGFDGFAEEQCRQFYAPVMGRPSLPPGRYFRLLLVRLRRRPGLRARHRVARRGFAGGAHLRGARPRPKRRLALCVRRTGASRHSATANSASAAPREPDPAQTTG